MLFDGMAVVAIEEGRRGELFYHLLWRDVYGIKM